MIFKNLSFSNNILLHIILAISGFIAALLNYHYTDNITISIILIIFSLWQIIIIHNKANYYERSLTRYFHHINNNEYPNQIIFEHKFKINDQFDKLLHDFSHTITQQHNSLSNQLNLYKIYLDYSPVSLMALYHDQSITLLNNQAKQFFSTPSVKTLKHLKSYHPDIYHTLSKARAGQEFTISLDQKYNNAILSFRLSELILDSKNYHLISVQNIHHEINAEQVRSWHDLSHVLTHELMNSLSPIHALSTTSELLLSDLRENLQDHPTTIQVNDILDDLEQSISTISRRNKQLGNFIQNYQSFKNKIDLHPSQTALTPLITSTIALFSNKRERENISIEMDERSADISLTIDPTLIEQILINVIKNAIEALENTTKANKIIIISISQTPEHIVINIVDNAVTLPPEQMKQIFTPFYTTKRNGSGIGLSLCQEIMTAHQGYMDCCNNEKGGTTFRLYFKNVV